MTGFLNKASPRPPCQAWSPRTHTHIPHLLHSHQPSLSWSGEGREDRQRPGGLCSLWSVQVSILAASGFCSLNLAFP